MFDSRIIPLQRRALMPVARSLHGAGISADSITITGFALGLFGVLASAYGWFTLALLGLALNRIADGLDGEVARMAGPTERGAFLDIALDFVFYAIFPLGFALNDPATNALPAAVLIASFVGTGSSFLAFSLIAERNGLTNDNYPSKGIYYLGGLTEGAETIGVFVLMCMLPQWFSFLAYGFAIACGFTTLTRWLMGWRMFGQDKNGL